MMEAACALQQRKMVQIRPSCVLCTHARFPTGSHTIRDKATAQQRCQCTPLHTQCTSECGSTRLRRSALAACASSLFRWGGPTRLHGFEVFFRLRRVLGISGVCLFLLDGFGLGGTPPRCEQGTLAAPRPKFELSKVDRGKRVLTYCQVTLLSTAPWATRRVGKRTRRFSVVTSGPWDAEDRHVRR